jgi:SulP family sulfate permease
MLDVDGLPLLGAEELSPSNPSLTPAEPHPSPRAAANGSSCASRLAATPLGRAWGAVRSSFASQRAGATPHWLRTYPWLPLTGQLREDATTGVTVGVMLIPQGMAYATLAGLPPIYGLYSSLAPLLAYGLLGTSPHLHFGPFGLVSVLVADGLGGAGYDAAACSAAAAAAEGVGMSAPGAAAAEVAADAACAEFEHAAVTMSLLVGLCHLAMAALRLDVLAEVLADSVMTGFTSAAAILIAASQAGKLAGIHVAHGLPFLELLFGEGGLLAKLGELNVATLLVSAASFALLALLGRLNARKMRAAPQSIPIPAQLVLVALSILTSRVLELEREWSVEVLGDVPAGLPVPRAPSLKHAMKLLRPSLIVALISFIINTSIVKVFSSRFEYSVSLQSELIATGLANAVGAFFSAFPASGSLSRGAVIANVGADRVSMMHNLICAAVIGATLLFLTDLLAALPKAGLAVIIITSISKMVNLPEAARLLRARHFGDFGLCVAAFSLTLVFGVQDGIILSVLLSLLLLLRSTARPHAYCLGLLPGTDLFVDAERYPGAAAVPGLMVFRFGASLHFANKDYFAASLLASEERHNEALRAENMAVPHGSGTAAAAAAAATAAATSGRGRGELTVRRVHAMVLDCSSIHDIDSSATKMLERMTKTLWERTSAPVSLMLSSLTVDVREQVTRDGALMSQLKLFARRDALDVLGMPDHGVLRTQTVIGHNNLFVTLAEAVAFARRVIHRNVQRSERAPEGGAGESPEVDEPQSRGYVGGAAALHVDEGPNMSGRATTKRLRPRAKNKRRGGS